MLRFRYSRHALCAYLFFLGFGDATFPTEWHQSPFSNSFGQFGLFVGSLPPKFPTPDEPGVRTSPPVVHVDELPNRVFNAAL